MKYGYYDELPAYIEDLYAEAEELQAKYEESPIFEDDEYFEIQKHIFLGEPLPEGITASYVRRVIEVEEIGLKADKAKLDARTAEFGRKREPVEEEADYGRQWRWLEKLASLLARLEKEEALHFSLAFNPSMG